MGWCGVRRYLSAGPLRPDSVAAVGGMWRMCPIHLGVSQALISRFRHQSLSEKIMGICTVSLNRGFLLTFLTVAGSFFSACSQSQSYEEAISRIFQLDVSRIEYVDRGGSDQRKAYEGGEVAMIKSWLLSATPPTYIGSYPKAEYRVVIYFGNNEKETVYVSGGESGYVMIEYMGYVLIAPPLPVGHHTLSGETDSNRLQ